MKLTKKDWLILILLALNIIFIANVTIQMNACNAALAQFNGTNMCHVCGLLEGIGVIQ